MLVSTIPKERRVAYGTPLDTNTEQLNRKSNSKYKFTNVSRLSMQ